MNTDYRHRTADDANAGSETSTQVRHCSVRGCNKPLQFDYKHKMCEECRGRHRVYANTKRAKRKMEKAAMGAQNGQAIVWMQEDNGLPIPEGLIIEPNADFYNPTWGEPAIDPALFVSNDSELAGALTLPRSKSPQPHEIGLPNGESNDTGILDNVLTHEFEDAPENPGITDPLLPPRYCSIKGCKALVPGNSFFKMCEPCRDRYRNYGTTKRAKWKREKEVAVAELEKMREETDKRRTDEGQSSMSPVEFHQYQADGLSQHSAGSNATALEANVLLPPRMCTVSHCREILPGNHQYRRCERHRIQNRHHSKLKRVRDKEVKAIAFDGWAAAVASSGRAGSVSSATGREADDETGDEEQGQESPQDIDPELLTRSRSVSLVGMVGAETPFGEPSTGVPPAARGTRRTNHVCSIKVCYNLLAPTNPWKMCDACRERDRAGRREKALRDSGIITTPPPRAPKGSKRAERERQKAAQATEEADDGVGAEKPKKRKKKKGAEGEAGQSDAAGSTAARPSSALEGQGANPTTPGADVSQDELFTGAVDPVPSDATTAVFYTQPVQQDTDTTGFPTLSQANFTSPTVVSSEGQCGDPALPSESLQVALTDQDVDTSAQGEAATAAPKKTTKRKSKKTPAPGVDAPTSSVNASNPTAPPGVHSPVAPSASESAPPDGVPSPAAPPQPHYYYMPSYGMTPYGAQAPAYTYGTPYPYAHPPPFSAYAPYAQAYSYPPPYGQTYGTQVPYAPPPSTQPMYSVSSDFVSRAEYTAASHNSQNQSPNGDGGVQTPYYGAFSAKTGEPHHRAQSQPSQLRRKRQWEEAAKSDTNKRPVTSQVDTAADTSRVEANNSNGSSEPSVTPPVVNQEPTVQSAQEVRACSSTTCHRTLPSGTAGTLCARCKERLKKKQSKAKQRFRLEPRRLLGPSQSS
ncbi:hypothetical protein WOLCODRAFT_165497 [Wolfiporia cocos MD-104 SS10]|uniref:Uncharacterized protein n=1 Tax=Wolfiporia cocos (strain MD-104) TaxID=742152 RepID=A0A2H3JRZ1_WOLCO|nr:hypothetical protein WOLCODRAFT_165497 [Wolfiporia cocos MD-104 SS10]